MRIRRKKHLDERLNNLNGFLLVADRDIVNVKEAVKNKKYFDFENMFGNSNPVEMEIGSGKGGFILELARRNPTVNYIAVELLANIIVMATEVAKAENLKNVKFFNSGAEYLPRYIKSGSVSKIYLNFSPPYPPKSNENRRLTNPVLVSNYKDFLTINGEVLQKTDDKNFFLYSVEKFKEAGFTVTDISGESDNSVQTEYEKKFREKGMPIYALKAKK